MIFVCAHVPTTRKSNVEHCNMALTACTANKLIDSFLLARVCMHAVYIYEDWMDLSFP